MKTKIETSKEFDGLYTELVWKKSLIWKMAIFCLLLMMILLVILPNNLKLWEKIVLSLFSLLMGGVFGLVLREDFQFLVKPRTKKQVYLTLKRLPKEKKLQEGRVESAKKLLKKQEDQQHLLDTLEEEGKTLLKENSPG